MVLPVRNPSRFLVLADREKGKVWEFLWREFQVDGSIRRKHIVIGTLEEYPTESAAQSAADALRLNINKQTPQALIRNISLETLVKHYCQHELPDIFNKTRPAPDAAGDYRKSYATQVTYDGYLRKWIVPRGLSSIDGGQGRRRGDLAKSTRRA